MGYWKLDEASGTRADSSGRANDLSATAAPGNAAGIVSNAVALNGSTQYLSRASGADLKITSGDWTLLAWAKRSASSQGTLIGKWNASIEYVFWINTDALMLTIRNAADDTTLSIGYTYMSSFSNDVWHLYCARYDSSAQKVRLSVDNKTIEETAYSAGFHDAENDFTIGALATNTQHFTGQIDEASKYARYLTDREVALYYNARAGLTFGGSVTGLAQKLVICDGDSITLGAVGLVANSRYPNQMDSLSSEALALRNMGRSGLATATILADAPTRIDPLFDAIYVRRIAVVMMGVNDLRNGGFSTASIIANISAYCTARRAAGFKVIVCTITPATDAGTAGSFAADRATVNASIRTNYPTYADGIADVGGDATIGGDSAPNNATYYGDKLHPTAAGNAIIASIIKAAVDVL
jgi:lysophospholipase L1-like esterase